MHHQANLTDAQYLDAIPKGDIELVKKFIAETKGTDFINARTYKENLPALSWAIVNKQTDIALLILNAGADINAEARKGVTPLYLAATLGNVEVVQALLKNPDIKINTVASNGYTPLEYAAIHGHTEIVKLLLAAGVRMQRDTLIDELTVRGHTHIAELIKANIEEYLQTQAFEIPANEIKFADKVMISKLSVRNIARLKKVTTNAYYQGNLNRDTFSTLVKQVSEKNPHLQPSIVEKLPDAMVNISGMVFQIDPKPLFSGGQGVIYGGFATPAATLPAVPDYCIKKFNPKDLQSAIHEANYLALMGRHAALVVQGDHISVVTKYQHGDDLETLRKKIDFSTLPFARRIRWLASGLTDLDKLHSAFRIHADIKTGNFIIDMDQDQMRLIDMGAAQKINSPKTKVSSVGFVDLKEGAPKKIASDMYSMGKVMAIMFPELFKLEERYLTFDAPEPNNPNNVKKVQIAHFSKIKTTNLTPFESAIMQLYDAMIADIAEHRCTSEQALKLCLGLLEKMETDQIDEKTLAELLNATINRKDFTIEDALRDSSRPAYVAASTAAEPRIAGAKAVEPPSEIEDPTPAKKQKTKKKKTDVEERKIHTKHTTSPATLFNAAPKKKQKVKEARPAARQGRKKKSI